MRWLQREEYAGFEDPTSNATDGNSLLLNLPRELRDMIYVYFLEARRPAPPSPPFAGPRTFRVGDEDVPLRDIAYPISLPPSHITSLLQTNRSVRSEVLELVDKRNDSSRSLPAELDLMATGYVLYPLWTRLPTIPNKNASLEVTVNLRIFSPEAFRSNDGWPRQPGVAFRSLLTLLNQFTRCGPAFTWLPGPVKPIASVETLTIRLSNYDIYTPRMFPPAVYETVRMCKALARRVDAGTWLGKIRVVVEDPEHRTPGFEGREWLFKVAEECSEDGLLERVSDWEDMGFFLEPESARFSVG